MNKEELKEKFGVGTSATEGDRNYANENKQETPYYELLNKRTTTPYVEFIKRDGESFSMPYSWSPAIVFKPDDGKVILKTMLQEIHITGRNLAPVKEALKYSQVLWIRESETGTDDKQYDSFVETITFHDPE